MEHTFTTSIGPQQDPYLALANVLQLAVFQASEGKGKERHAWEGEDFDKQPICEIDRRLDGGGTGPLFQAVKKIYESRRLAAQGKRDAAKQELLGAIVYIAGAVIRMEEAQ